ncbi:MAG: DUF6377 domain-containing protein [Prevotellaceae bacterium]|nr:DUF6377 domain-containing protein [Prevotellaceae bacterium]
MQNLDTLDCYISKEKKFTAEKENNIKNIKIQISENQSNDAKLYLLYNDLYEQYKSYVYDSAFYCVENLIMLAQKMDDNCKTFEVRTKLCFCYLSSGLFSEAFGEMKKLEQNSCDEENLRIQYLLIKARLYYDIADYNNDENDKKYNDLGNQILNLALEMMPKNTNQYYSSLGLKAMKEGNYNEAILNFNKLISSKDCSEHDIAIATSSLAYIYKLQGDLAVSKEFLIKAAIADIKSSTRETVALRNLAQQLYNEGDIFHAAQYVRKAFADAVFYNARHRQVEIGHILPIIEEERVNLIVEQKNKITIFLIIVSVLTLLTIAVCCFFVINKIKLAKANKIIQKNNDEVLIINKKLSEANKIKEEYIGYFFSLDSEYISKLEAFQRWVKRKIKEKRYQDLQTIPAKLDAKEERNKLFKKFDAIFIQLFPNFVSEFNALLQPESRITLEEDELLNSDLRIYALMRLGVRNNEKIAQFMCYSVNTIYTYKSKIKAQSLYCPEEFRKRLMKIQ